jgi:hypothetical protein
LRLRQPKKAKYLEKKWQTLGKKKIRIKLQAHYSKTN